MTSTFRFAGIPVGAKELAIVQTSIHHYKYKSPPLSLSERLFLDKFWDRCTLLYPKWLAPNVITLAGGLCILAGTIALLLTCTGPDGPDGAPNWIFTFCAAMLFLYQTLDGSDGKQARRTKSGSSLGHLFDHGLDALAGTLMATWPAFLLGLGFGHPIGVGMLALFQIAFFASNLVNLHLGWQMFFLIDVMEAELGEIVYLLLTGFFGVVGWHYPLFTLPVVGKVCVVHVSVVVTTGLLLNNIRKYFFIIVNLYRKPVADRPPPAEGRSLRDAIHQGTSVVVNSGLIMLNWYLVYRTHAPLAPMRSRPESPIYAPLPNMVVLLPWYIVTVLGFAGMTLHMLVTTVAQLPFPTCHWSIILQVALAFGTARDPVGGYGGWCTAAAAVLCYAHFVGRLANALAEALNVRIFKIKPPAQE